MYAQLCNLRPRLLREGVCETSPSPSAEPEDMSLPKTISLSEKIPGKDPERSRIETNSANASLPCQKSSQKNPRRKARQQSQCPQPVRLAGPSVGDGSLGTRPRRVLSVIVLPGCLSRFRPSGFGHRGFTVASCLPVFRCSCIGDYFRQTSGKAVLCSLRRVEK